MREQAQQIQKMVVALGDYMGIKCHACIGGTNVPAEQAPLEPGSHGIGGNPGRVPDMIPRRPPRQPFLLLLTKIMFHHPKIKYSFQRLPESP